MAGRGKAAYRLCYNILSLLIIFWVLAAPGCETVLYFAPGVWSLIMYLFQLLVVIALCICLGQTGIGQFLGISQLREKEAPPSRLVSNGWYAVVRHPLYLLSLLFLAASPVMTLRRALLTAAAIPYFVIGALLEERRLAGEFGNSYLRYRREVPFMFPRLPFSRRASFPPE